MRPKKLAAVVGVLERTAERCEDAWPGCDWDHLDPARGTVCRGGRVGECACCSETQRAALRAAAHAARVLDAAAEGDWGEALREAKRADDVARRWGLDAWSPLYEIVATIEEEEVPS